MIVKDVLIALLDNSPLWVKKNTGSLFDEEYPVYISVSEADNNKKNADMEIELGVESILVTFNSEATESRITVELCLWNLVLEADDTRKEIVDEHVFNCVIGL